MRSSLRILAGIIRGRSVICEIDGFRPTLARRRAVLFDTLAFNLPENFSFFDGFAGSGVIGIEALSRGAGRCIFVDINRKYCDSIKKNLVRLLPKSDYKVFDKSIFTLYKGEPMDVIFLDPPYDQDFIIPKVVRKLIDRGWTHEKTIIITETHKKTRMKMPYFLWKTKTIGSTLLNFYKLVETPISE